MTIKFLWNGIKADGKFYKGSWSRFGGPGTSLNPDTITFYADSYASDLSDLGFNIINDSDVMTDYFEKDRFRIAPGHEKHAEAVAAWKARNVHYAKKEIKRLKNRIPHLTGWRLESAERDLREREALVANSA